MTRNDYRCPRCHSIKQDVPFHLGEQIEVLCPSCDVPMVVYFGARRCDDLHINYGFRPDRYASKTDRDIAQFQFTNL